MRVRKQILRKLQRLKQKLKRKLMTGAELPSGKDISGRLLHRKRAVYWWKRAACWFRFTGLTGGNYHEIYNQTRDPGAAPPPYLAEADVDAGCGYTVILFKQFKGCYGC